MWRVTTKKIPAVGTERVSPTFKFVPAPLLECWWGNSVWHRWSLHVIEPLGVGDFKQSINHVTGSRSSLRHTSTIRRRNDYSPMSDSGGNHAAASGGPAAAPALENFVKEERQQGFKLRVRFVATDSPQLGGGDRREGCSASRTTTTSVDCPAVVQHHHTDGRVEMNCSSEIAYTD